jgi:hypothetical protein
MNCQKEIALGTDHLTSRGEKGAYGFLFRSEIFFRTIRELEYLFFLSLKARILFPEFNIRLYDKNSESDNLFFPPSKSEYFFQQHWDALSDKKNKYSNSRVDRKKNSERNKKP